MEQITTFIESNVDLYLLTIIVLGGIYITKYTKTITFLADAHKVLIASVVFSVIFYFIEDCRADCLSQYLFTYLFATSFYEIIVKSIIEKVSKIFKNKPN